MIRELQKMPAWFRGVSLLFFVFCYGALCISLALDYRNGKLLPGLPLPYAVFFAIPLAGLLALMMLIGAGLVISHFYYPRKVRRVVVACHRRLRNLTPHRYDHMRRQHVVLQSAVRSLLVGSFYGCGIAVCLTFSLAAVGLLAPPYTGPTPPTSMIQDAHMFATRAAAILTSRPELFFTGLAAPLVILILGSWARRHGKFN